MTNAIRIVVRCITDGTYARDETAWTLDAKRAHRFPTLKQAELFCHEKKLPDVEIMVFYQNRPPLRLGLDEEMPSFQPRPSSNW